MPKDAGTTNLVSSVGQILGTQALTAASASGTAAAAGGSAAAGAAAASFNPIGLIVGAVFVMWSLLARSKPRDRREQGYSFEFQENPTDPTLPIPMVYGAPKWTPPVLADYVTPDAVNALSPTKGAKRIRILSLGAGPVDGRNLDIDIDGVRAFERVDANSDLAERLLSPVDADKKVYRFPKANVLRDSVEVFVDGTFVGSGGTFAGDVDNDRETTTTDARVTPKKFRRNSDDPDLPEFNVIGGLLPTDGKVNKGSVEVKVKTSGLRSIRFTHSGIARSRGDITTLKSDDVVVRELPDGTPYFYVRIRWESDEKLNRIDYFLVSFKSVDTVTTRVDDGALVVRFPESRTSSEQVTAHYLTSTYGEDMRVTFRDGDKAQDPLPLDDGTRLTFNVGTELLKATEVTYSTKNPVHDVEVSLATGSDGIFTTGSGGTSDASRNIIIKLKETDASDAPGKNNDPSTGWITLEHPDTGTTEHRLTGATIGQARWFFSVADMLAATKGGTGASAAKNLPLKKYDVSVTATDAPNTLPNGQASDRVHNKLSFDLATEIVRTPLTLPLHATLTIEIGDASLIAGNPLMAVQCAGRMVWVPTSNAEYSATTGRPEPGSWQWTRNPVWCTCDFIASAHFGAGEYYDWQHIDVSSAASAASFCDDSVQKSPASSDTETRSELDIVLQHRSALIDHAAQMCAGAQVLPILSGGTWKFVKDEAASSVLTLTDADIFSNEISMRWPSVEESPTEVEFAFTPEDQDWQLEPDVVRRDGTEPERNVTLHTDLTGVRRRSQAIRAASLLLQQAEKQRLAVEMVCDGWRALQLEAGDVVTLTASDLGLTSKLFRVTHVGVGSDFRIGLRLSEYDATVYSDTGVVYKVYDRSLPGTPPPSPFTGHRQPRSDDGTARGRTRVAPRDFDIKRVKSSSGGRGSRGKPNSSNGRGSWRVSIPLNLAVLVAAAGVLPW